MASDLQDHVAVKAALLAEGVNFSQGFLDSYGPPFLPKRRAYGNSDDSSFWSAVIPQELFLADGAIVCGIHARASSLWMLDADNGHFVLRHADGTARPVTFPITPHFYSSQLPSGRAGRQVGTLYGGHSLGIFVYGSCVLVDRGQACQYCSIQPNRTRQTEFADIVKTDDVEAVVAAALEQDSDVITQVMINGGNFRERDRGFRYYIDICQSARRAIDSSPAAGRVELHLIVYPPSTLGLIEELAELDVSVAMNTEVFSPELFARYCPGKVAEGGHAMLFAALERAVATMGQGKVFSIFVGGLEPLPSLREGLAHAFSIGVIPVVNVFHADPGTALAGHPIPSAAEVLSIGYALQSEYARHSYARPFYEHCGRHALDAEAHQSLFSPA